MSSTETKQPTYQLTPRDRLCLCWIALQYAIRFDQLQVLLFRHTPEQDRYKCKPGSDRVSLDRTYEIIKKWQALGLIEKKIILHGDKLWIWLSRAGLRQAETPLNYSGAPSSIRLPHLYYINQVRLAVEAKRPDDLWQSERHLRKELPPVVKGESQPHTPDALLTNTANGKITAIEVECHAKTDSELEDDLRELAVSYRSVWYFTTPTTRRQVEATLDTFEPALRKPFVLYELKEYGNAYNLS
jgi:hypothetical protein